MIYIYIYIYYFFCHQYPEALKCIFHGGGGGGGGGEIRICLLLSITGCAHKCNQNTVLAQFISVEDDTCALRKPHIYALDPVAQKFPHCCC